MVDGLMEDGMVVLGTELLLVEVELSTLLLIPLEPLSLVEVAVVQV